MAGKAGVAYNSDMETMIPVLIAVVGIGLVLAPVLRQGGGWFRGVAAGPPIPVLEPAATGDAAVDDAAIDREVERYRAALRAGTLCVRCRFANPADARFCADCGKRLPGV